MQPSAFVHHGCVRWLSACFVLLLAAHATPARADLVVVVSPEGAVPIDGLEGDLRAAGHTSLAVSAATDLPLSGFVALVEDAGARAAIRITPSEAEVWVATEVGWALDEALPLGAESLRLRLVEILVARLAPPIEVAAPPPPEEEPPTPVDPVPTGASILLEVGVFGAPSFEVQPWARAGLALRFDRFLGLVIRIGSAASGASVSASEGRVSVWPVLASVGLVLHLLPPTSVLGVRLEVGAIGGPAIAVGTASRAPWQGSTEVGAVFGPSAGIGLDLPLGDRAGLSLSGEIDVNVTALAIAIAEREVGRFGEPLLAVSFGLWVRP